ncbi:hypothetical protein L6164_036607 [Bauhinia variegata]|uniref:Uncharacterized protein n=1 Tax=Bauhinia variegata TaxID=167791 RepID=A0ACB9KHQ0_BAUVA|nr:hypothetical protein L6164_036607 [Bauhinia variegata]
MQNYEFMQSMFKVELEEIKRWSENWGLTDMGFAREKTTYCYFAISAATSLSHDSYVRMFVAKSATIITVVDDFFDKEGTLGELEGLTAAVRRWDSKGLKGHSKVLFDVLDALVSEAATKYLQQEGIDIKESLKDLWHETFVSWLVEAKWARNGHTPSIDDYIKIGMISIAVHTIVLPGSCFLKPGLSNHKLRPAQYETITKLLMVTCRLLNDLQSYQKEKEEGKMNSVLLNLVENPESNMEDSISLVGEIIDKKKKELLEHALIDGHCDLPKAIKHFHLSCLKVFQMFFNSSNRYDSDTELLQDINKAIYLPVRRNSKHVTVESFQSGPKKKKAAPLSNFNWHFKHTSKRSFTANQVSLPALKHGIVALAQKLVLGIN